VAGLTDLEGFAVGVWTDAEARTGVTVVRCPPEGCLASASFLGPAPGTREAALLAPEKPVDRVHALVFTGGSALGLASAGGVAERLAEEGIGHPTRVRPIPIVPAAVVYDLLVGRPVWPGAEAGYRAAAGAGTGPVPVGPVGAGAGATAGKYRTPVPTGQGSAAVEEAGVRVAALAVVNPVGDVYDLEGRLLAGHGEPRFQRPSPLENTTLVAVGLESPLTKPQARLLADAGQAAIGRVVRPSHTPWDGDAVFVLSTGRGPAAPLGLLAALVQEAVAAAIIGAARAAGGPRPTRGPRS